MISEVYFCLWFTKLISEVSVHTPKRGLLLSPVHKEYHISFSKVEMLLFIGASHLVPSGCLCPLSLDRCTKTKGKFPNIWSLNVVEKIKLFYGESSSKYFLSKENLLSRKIAKDAYCSGDH